jgi:uncharacterized coiled-coil DUF342 family protein
MPESSSNDSTTIRSTPRTNEQLRGKIEEIRNQLASIRIQITNAEQEARHWKEKRDGAHEQTRNLRSQIESDRENRDSLNSQVSALKIQRNNTRDTVREKIERIQSLRQKLTMLQDNAPRIDVENLRREIKALEWKIQTSSLTLNEEAPLVNKVNALELQLEAQNEIDATRTEITEIQKEIDEANQEASILHGKISDLAEQSQGFHKKMTESLQQLNNLRDEANSYHQEFIQRVGNLEIARKDRAKAKTQLRTLNSELHSLETAEREAKESTTKEAVKKEAQKKLKKGKKLTFEEFKLVLDDD